LWKALLPSHLGLLDAMRFESVATTEPRKLSLEDGFTQHQPTSTLAIAPCRHD
jgi:hypothetical protein